MKNRIHLAIEFSDAILPVINCDDGQQRVPLKPIIDQIGIQWKGQKRKLLADDYLVERFGLILGVVRYPQEGETGASRDQYLIRLDRVTAFLNTLSPRNITSKGNSNAADWLKAKHQEWDDALHAYESSGVAVKPIGKGSVIDAIAKIDRIKDLSLKRVAAIAANDQFGLDIPVGRQLPLEE